jgi:phenylacetate-CoA ligase
MSPPSLRLSKARCPAASPPLFSAQVSVSTQPGREYAALAGMNRTKTDRALSALRSFWESDLDEVLSRPARVDAGAAVLEFFQGVARDVPAYRTFLERAGVDVSAVRIVADFAHLPTTTKDNYHRAFPLHLLCRDGRLDACDFVAVSSGSTGEPSGWPRFVADEMGTAMRFEQVLHDAMSAVRTRTLGVICFALGSRVGGMYTTAACRHIAAKGYPLTLVTPGNNRAEILRVIRALAPSFEQIVLFGYPPFLKDVIDAGRSEGIGWERHSVRLVMAGEVFSESWRTLVCDRLGQSDAHLRTASMYGTADGGVLANETPLSIRIRQFLADRPDAARELFGEARLPTLCQYDPLHRYFEADHGGLVFTGDVPKAPVFDLSSAATTTRGASTLRRPHGCPAFCASGWTSTGRFSPLRSPMPRTSNGSCSKPTRPTSTAGRPMAASRSLRKAARP